MPMIAIDIPPGVIKNGTPYKRRGRWENSNLVRWFNNSARVIGGWLRYTNSAYVNVPALCADVTIEAVRDGYVWKSNAQVPNVVFGSNRNLYHVSSIGAVTNITPAGVVVSSKDAVLASGYGNNPYGVGAYGVANVIAGQLPTPPNRWAFANFGELLLTCQRGLGSLYELNAGTLTLAVVTNAPTAVQDVIVTSERIVMTIGGTATPRRVKWSDQENRTLWVAAASNQAGELTLPGSGKLLRIINVLQQYVIISEDDVHVARYIAPPYVFSFELAARNCGPIAPEAVVGTERFAVWWGDNSFWLYDGAVKPLPCDVMDFLVMDVNTTQSSKITSFTNSVFSEVWWYYQSTTSTTTECDSYVVWNYADNTWCTGRIDRTGGVDSGVLASPLHVSSASLLYVHEQQGVFPSEGSVFLESGELDMDGGNVNMACRYLYPDTETFGDIAVEILGRQFPTDSIYMYGPYVYANPTPTRAMGRALKFKFTLLTASAELGVMRADIAPMGTGRR